MSNGISLLGQNQANTSRLLDMQKTMNDLLRQSTTQKKYENLGGFGNDAGRLLGYRANIDTLDTYGNNIDIASNRISLMSTAMSQGRTLGENLVSSIGGELMGGNIDVASINTIAKTSLDFMQTMTNLQDQGRYLFAGSSVSTPPLTSRATANNLMQAQVTGWLNGSISTNQLITNLQNFTPADLGIDPSLSASGPVSVRVDDQTEIDYTVKADGNGFDKLMAAMALGAAMKTPNPATDVPNLDDLAKVMQAIENTARDGMTKITDANTMVSNSNASMLKLKDSQTEEKALYQTTVDKQENADATDVLTKLQFLQTQLSASYQVTNIVSQLSLVNFLS